MAGVEAVVLFGCAYLGFLTRNLELPPFSDYFWAATVFASAQVVTMVAMGVYESRMREGLPPVGVVDDMTDRPLAVDAGDTPIESDSIAWPAFVFAEWIRRCADEPTVGW